MKFHYLIRYIFSLLVLLFMFSCKTYLEKATEELKYTRTIRVKLSVDNKIVIPPTKDLVIEDAVTGRLIALEKKSKEIVIEADGKYLKVNGKITESPLDIYLVNEAFITINSTLYTGLLRILPDGETLNVINYIPLETYLLSVISSEMPLSFDIEALKAQAVIARTYAVYFILQNRNKFFDVDDTVRYQVFKGYTHFDDEKLFNKVYEAVKSTEGLIVTYENAPVLAFFHANSGGFTISSGDYFGPNSELAYCIAKEDVYSLNQPGAEWKYTMIKSEFLKKTGMDKSIFEEGIKVDDKGFVRFFESNDIQLTPKQIRPKIGYSMLKSERFRVILSDEFIHFEGIGYGHGVGLSQWGAQKMAVDGFAFDEIINFYYTDVDIEPM